MTFMMFAQGDVKDKAYLVSLDERVMGVVEEEIVHELEEYIEAYKEEKALKFSHEIEFKSELTLKEVEKNLLEEKYPKDLYYEKDELDVIVSKIKENLDYLVEGYAILIQGEEHVVLDSEDKAKKLIDEVKSAYLEEYEEQGATIKEVIIKEDVDILRRKVSLQDIKEFSEAKDKLLQGEEKKVAYEIEKGESLSEVAVKNDTTVENLRKVNFGGEDQEKEKTLRPGDELELEEKERLFSIVASMEIKEEEEISYDTEYTEDDSLWQGETRVLENGEAGKKEVTYRVIKEDGRELEREVKDQKVLSEPKNKVVAKGTASEPAVSGSNGFIWPISSSEGRVTSPYGMRNGSFHSGVDYAVPEGTPILAAAGGTVEFSGVRGSYGNLIVIDHGGGYQTYYAHNSVNYVQEGDRVQQGEKIGLVGTTGRATGSHLHFELHRNGTHVDPLKYFNP